MIINNKSDYRLQIIIQLHCIKTLLMSIYIMFSLETYESSNTIEVAIIALLSRINHFVRSLDFGR